MQPYSTLLIRVEHICCTCALGHRSTSTTTSNEKTTSTTTTTTTIATSTSTSTSTLICSGDTYFKPSPGPWELEATCAPCTECQASQFITQNCTARTDRTCQFHQSACNGIVEYETRAPGIYSDRTCGNVHVCNIELEFETEAPAPTNDRSCANLTVCTDEQYESDAATATTDRVCGPKTVCKETEFVSVLATAVSDRTCTPLTTCAESELLTESTAPTPVSDRQCSPCTECLATEHEISICTGAKDRRCKPNRVCGMNEFQSVAATASTNRICTKYPRCGWDEFVLVTNETEVLRVARCEPKTTCEAGQAVARNPTQTSDRTCVDCTPGSNYTVSENAKECSPCTPTQNIVCSPGLYAKKCSVDVDALCSRCPQGTYKYNASGCAKWDVCGAGTELMNTPNTDQNSICIPCSKGTFRSDTMDTCLPYTRCKIGLVAINATTTNDVICVSSEFAPITAAPVVMSTKAGSSTTQDFERNVAAEASTDTLMYAIIGIVVLLLLACLLLGLWVNRSREQPPILKFNREHGTVEIYVDNPKVKVYSNAAETLLPIAIKPHKSLLVPGKQGQTPLYLPVPGYKHPSRHPLSIVACTTSLLKKASEPVTLIVRAVTQPPPLLRWVAKQKKSFGLGRPSSMRGQKGGGGISTQMNFLGPSSRMAQELANLNAFSDDNDMTGAVDLGTPGTLEMKMRVSTDKPCKYYYTTDGSCPLFILDSQQMGRTTSEYSSKSPATVNFSQHNPLLTIRAVAVEEDKESSFPATLVIPRLNVPIITCVKTARGLELNVQQTDTLGFGTNELKIDGQPATVNKNFRFNFGDDASAPTVTWSVGKESDPTPGSMDKRKYVKSKRPLLDYQAAKQMIKAVVSKPGCVTSFVASCFLELPVSETPKVTFEDGVVTLEGANLDTMLYYTVDGSVPVAPETYGGGVDKHTLVYSQGSKPDLTGLNKTVVIKAIAHDPLSEPSTLQTLLVSAPPHPEAEPEDRVPAPSIQSLKSRGGVQIMLGPENPQKGIRIFYTTNNETPAPNVHGTFEYDATDRPFITCKDEALSTTVKAIALSEDEELLDSNVSSDTILVQAKEQARAPTMQPQRHEREYVAVSFDVTNEATLMYSVSDGSSRRSQTKEWDEQPLVFDRVAGVDKIKTITVFTVQPWCKESHHVDYPITIPKRQRLLPPKVEYVDNADGSVLVNVLPSSNAENDATFLYAVGSSDAQPFAGKFRIGADEFLQNGEKVIVYVHAEELEYESSEVREIVVSRKVKPLSKPTIRFEKADKVKAEDIQPYSGVIADMAKLLSFHPTAVFAAELKALFIDADVSDGTKTFASAVPDFVLDKTECAHRLNNRKLNKLLIECGLKEKGTTTKNADFVKQFDSDGDGKLQYAEMAEPFLQAFNDQQPDKDQNDADVIKEYFGFTQKKQYTEHLFIQFIDKLCLDEDMRSVIGQCAGRNAGKDRNEIYNDTRLSAVLKSSQQICEAVKKTGETPLLHAGTYSYNVVIAKNDADRDDTDTALSYTVTNVETGDVVSKKNCYGKDNVEFTIDCLDLVEDTISNMRVEAWAEKPGIKSSKVASITVQPPTCEKPRIITSEMSNVLSRSYQKNIKAMVEVRIECAGSDADDADTELWYTLEGDEPVPGDGKRYTKPFKVEEGAVVMAIAMRHACKISAFAEEMVLIPDESAEVELSTEWSNMDGPETFRVCCTPLPANISCVLSLRNDLIHRRAGTDVRAQRSYNHVLYEAQSRRC